MRRWVFRLGLVVLPAALTGCGAEPADPAPLPADQVVFRLEVGSNGFASRLDSAISGPDLVVYGDGRVLRPADGRNTSGRPPAYDLARADPSAVARFAADAERRKVVGETTDFGDPPVTDQAFTSVLLHGPGGQATALVYALDDRFDDGVTRAQRRTRGELDEIIAAAFALSGDAARIPFDPDQVRVAELEATDVGSTPGPRWPGPDPAGFLRPTPSGYPGATCGTLSGPEADTAYAAARENPHATWTVGGRTRVLAVAVVLPGERGCEP